MKELNFYIFLGSSAVERSTVNRLVAGSNPARGVHLKIQNTARPVKGSFFMCHFMGQSKTLYG